MKLNHRKSDLPYSRAYKKKLGTKLYKLFSQDISRLEDTIIEKYGRAADSNDVLAFVNCGIANIFTNPKDAEFISVTLNRLINGIVSCYL